MSDRMADSWLKLHRKSRHSAAFEDPLMWKVWCGLLMDANWERRQLYNGLILEPGQLMIGQEKYAEDLGVTRKVLRLRLQWLEKCGNVATERAKNGTLVTICNWATYQRTQDEEGPASGPRKGQGRAKEGPRKGQGRAREEEKKEEEEVKEGEEEERASSSSSPLHIDQLSNVGVFDGWWSIWPRPKRVGYQLAQAEYLAAIADLRKKHATIAGAEEFLADRLQQFIGSPKARSRVCPHPATWLRDGWYLDDPTAWAAEKDRQPGRVVCHRAVDRRPIQEQADECFADLKQSLDGKTMAETAAEAMRKAREQ